MLTETRQPMRARSIIWFCGDHEMFRSDVELLSKHSVLKVKSSAEYVIKIGVSRWNVTQSHTKIVPGSLNSSNLKMSTTDYQQPSDLNEFYRDEERHIIPPGASAEQPVRTSVNSYLRKIWLATSTIVTRGSWGNFAITAHSTTARQCTSNSLELV